MTVYRAGMETQFDPLQVTTLTVDRAGLGF